MRKLMLLSVFSIIGLTSGQLSAQDYSLSAVQCATPFCPSVIFLPQVQIVDSGLTGITNHSFTINRYVDGVLTTFTSNPSVDIAAGGSLWEDINPAINANIPGRHHLVFAISPADANPSNDTIDIWYTVSMSGTYTIDPSLPVSATNFTTIKSAFDTLNSVGICGPVVFNIASGTYNEQARINQIAGSSAINTITIQSQSGQANDVIWAYTPVGASDNYTLMINGTDYVTVQNLSMQSIGNSNYSRVLVMDSMAVHNQIKNNRFIGINTTVNSNALALVFSNAGTSANDSITLFENNHFLNNSYGLYLYGASISNPEDSVTIRGNLFENQRTTGVFTYYMTNLMVDSNVFRSNSTSTGYSGIYGYNIFGNTEYTRNSIFASNCAGDLIYLRETKGNSSERILVANNLLVQKNNTATLRGIYPYNCEYVDIAFNTIRIHSGSTSGGRAIYINSAASGTYGNVRVLNNIAENTGGGYAIEISSNAITQGYVTSCDYNNYLSSGTYIAKFGSTNCSNLVAWLTATTSQGYDTHSISIDPVFNNDSTYYFSNAAVNGLGTYMASVPQDIESQVRPASPDMGAYEYQLVNHDIAVLEIIKPTSGCGKGSNELVTIRLFNNGLSDESNFPVVFSINGGLSYCPAELIPLLVAGDTIDYTFASTADLSSVGTFEIVGKVLLASDERSSNDSIEVNVNSYYTISSFPYMEDFESGAGNWEAGGTNSSWQLGLPANPTISSAYSGVNAWITNLTGNHNNNENSYVISPCFDLSGMTDPWIQMSIFYECETGWDGSNLEYSSDGGLTWHIVGAYGDPNWYNDMDVDGIANNTAGWTGNNGSGSGNWIATTHSLMNLTVYPSVRFRVRFGSGASNNDDGFAFDDVEIYDRGVDIAMLGVSAPTGTCGLGPSEPIIFEIANYGTTAHDSIVIQYSLDGGTTNIYDTVFTSIGADDTLSFITNQTFDFSALGSYTITYQCLVPEDILAGNNNGSYTFWSQPMISVYPYAESFESNQGYWYSPTSTWHAMTPVGPTINYAYDGSISWTIEDYNGILESPCFDFSNLYNPAVSFYMFTNLMNNTEGVTFQYTTDGQNWNNIGNTGDTSNWYNSSTISLQSFYFGTGEGWTGNTSDYILASHPLGMLAHESFVKFRFIASSMASGALDGFAFDQFNIYELPTIDIRIDSLLSPVNGCGSETSIVSVSLFNNNSINTIPAGDSLFLSCIMDGTLIQEDTLVLSSDLLPASSITHSFDNMVDMLNTPWSYEFEVIVRHHADNNQTNDTLRTIIDRYAFPVVDLPEDTVLCGDQSVLLNAGAGADSYLWSSGDVSSSLLVDTAMTGGYGSFIYSVVVTDNTCSTEDSTEITFTDCTLIMEDQGDEIKVYPNPATDFVFIDQVPTNAQIILMNSQGAILIHEDNVACGIVKLDVSTLKSGIYFIQIQTQNNSIFKSIMLE